MSTRLYDVFLVVTIIVIIIISNNCKVIYRHCLLFAQSRATLVQYEKSDVAMCMIS